MKRETSAERAAWTAHIEGEGAAKQNKYGAQRTGKYASKREAMVAARLHALHNAGVIQDLQEQVRFVLVEGQGKIRPIVYVADFTFAEDGKFKIIDVKGFTKDKVYRLKKKLLKLLHNLDIEEL